MVLKRLPQHVAIIMDGNGRWAKKRGLPRVAGHKEGLESVRAVVREARRLGIKVLTLYAFSKENWKRPRAEVAALMGLLRFYLKRELPELKRQGIKLMAIGETELLPPKAYQALSQAIEETSSAREMILNLALSYGGRAEIARAARILAEACLKGHLRPDEIDENIFANYLYTAGLPDPDLIIRTSGEMRLSNFLLYQSAYSELYITPTLWPDFREAEFMAALEEYSQRERRFGLTSEQIRCTGKE
ncbi:isoprenyl transferase [Thermosulfuriphilus ammonigenes]|uniref:Isoprenyl transferase n=1 Tax=Thermosulfuriphilus ammonigenes TaxID=1936021 RepID=A0A6G7PXT9_9BACT|nr:isoprenyl transferase [Thermosulfuriphilus ammonigenes]MBA2849681.1 undecaprenyl diphosphate synthase [Thermosulfuriphilus ammonigenes]QIJ72223.1 isoprenyl transferase [Thermosulfuriphilus ammonigenes]HFB83337.1 isoprenyl transferase [Thermodesulfatator sp.]